MGLFAMIVFWFAAIRLWVVDEPKLPLIFIGLWLVCFFGFPYLKFSPYVFIATEALMAAILLIVAKYKEGS